MEETEAQSCDPPVQTDEPMQETSENVDQSMEATVNDPETIKSEDVEPKPSQSLPSPQRVSSIKRLFTPEEIQQIKSVYCSGLTEELSSKEKIREYFSEFGDVVRVFMSLKKMACTVHYKDHKSAANAKKYGGVIGDKRFSIFWSQSSLSKSSKSPPAAKKEERKEDVTERDRKVKEVKEDEPSTITTRSQTRRKTSESSPPNKVTEDKPVKSRRGKGKGKAEKAILTADVDVVFTKNATIKDLQEVLKKPAKTPEEKYRVLEARDKLMRMERGKQLKQRVAGRLHGTCPDMCPEKERYLRESQHQVHPYELKSAKEYSMNHAAAIKQYSRSSADQEEPLPHELRPSEVLMMAMNYMVLNIMDLSERKEENLRDWYFYVWDRTRAIRKDITQQQLCDMNSVLLVEHCARFHIHCAERLVAEDLTVFDEKINNENLTKCLQTLKHLYHDLAMKGEYCPNEAEFRGYIILMNLGDGNFMWEVQELRQEIQQSVPVRFAVQVYFALSSGNYVRFFKLVKSASYLNACLMHRYFNQVRTKALAAMARSYSFQSKVAQFPLTNLAELLNFESIQQGEMFCEHYGLELDQTRKFICLGRNTHPPTNSVFPPTRAIYVIESKRRCSIGEVIVGGKITESAHQSHSPHSSFNELGMLRNEAWNALDQEGSSPVLEPTVETPAEPAIDKEALIEELSQPILQGLIDETVKQEVKQISENMMEYVNKLSIAFLSMYCETFVREYVRDICSSTWREMKNQKVLEDREAEKTRKMFEELIDKSSKEMKSSILKEVVNSLCRNEASSVLREEKEKHTAVKELTTELLNDVTKSLIKEVCNELISHEQEEKARKLLLLAEDVKKQTRKYYLNLFLKAYEKKKQLKISMQGFPAWISSMSLEEQVKWFGSSCHSEEIFSSKRKWSTAFGDGQNTSTQTYPLIPLDNNILRKLTKSMRRSGSLNHHHECKFKWKVVISLPEFWDGKADVTSQWIDKCFVVENNPRSADDPLLLLSRTSIDDLTSLDVIIKKEIGISRIKRSTLGVNAILFVLNDKQETFYEDIQRLNYVVKHKAILQPCQLSVLVIGTGRFSKMDIYALLDLQTLLMEKVLTKHSIFYHEENSAKLSHESLFDSLCMLAETAEFPPSLEVQPLQELMHQLLTEELWVAYNLRAKEDEIFQLMMQDPNDLIIIYNVAVMNLSDACSQRNYLDFQDASDCQIDALDENYVSVFNLPPHWIRPKYLYEIKKLVQLAKIPKIPSLPAKDFQELGIILQDYCSRISSDFETSVKVYSSVMQILEQGYLTDNAQQNYPKLSYYSPWPSVLKVLIKARLEGISFVDPMLPGCDISVVIHEGIKQIMKSGGNWGLEPTDMYVLLERVNVETSVRASHELEDAGDKSSQNVSLKDMKEALDKMTAALDEQSSRFVSLNADLECSIALGHLE